MFDHDYNILTVKIDFDCNSGFFNADIVSYKQSCLTMTITYSLSKLTLTVTGVLMLTL
jgi:hypothetical protein